jgi:hypothetical protein
LAETKKSEAGVTVIRVLSICPIGGAESFGSEPPKKKGGNRRPFSLACLR